MNVVVLLCNGCRSIIVRSPLGRAPAPSCPTTTTAPLLERQHPLGLRILREISIVRRGDAARIRRASLLEVPTLVHLVGCRVPEGPIVAPLFARTKQTRAISTRTTTHEP
jgi:hypothetical protein